MSIQRCFALTAILALATNANISRAQIADDNPECRKDAVLGIVCNSDPPVFVAREQPLKIAAGSEFGKYDGFLAGVRYDHELRGTDHLAHAEFFMGRVSSLVDGRTVAKAELMGTFSMGKAHRPVIGLRHLSSAEISRPFTLITGVRLGRAQQHATMSLETGAIRNRNNGADGLETTIALAGYQNLPFLELDAAVRAGMGWGAGGSVTGLSVGAGRRIGSQIKVRAEWSGERLSGHAGDAAAASNQWRLMLSVGTFGKSLRRPEILVPESAAQANGDDELVSPQARERDLARATIHFDSAVSAKNVFEGPPPGKKGDFGFREVVECTYDNDTDVGAGNTPKFSCTHAEKGKLKVKYGCGNREVFAEVAATRLMWLLGFEADQMYPVIVHCKNCPPTLRETTPAEKLTGRFECASVELKYGDPIESEKDQGWRWDELDKVSEREGGASRAQIDALKLLAVLLQHNDSKAPNQRIICNDEAWSDDKSTERSCANPRLVVQDVGATFGGAGNRVRHDSGVDLVHWREQRIWRDGKRCVANLAGATNGGTIFDPEISEAGRAYLAALLMKVSAEQIHDLFRVSQVTIHDPSTTVEQWESAFWYKAWQIVNHSCPTAS